MPIDKTPEFLDRRWITALYTYPVKSLRGVAISEIEVTLYGLKGDRQWAVIGPDGRQLSVRKCASLATIGVAIVEGALVLSHVDKGEIVVEPSPMQVRSIKLTDTLIDDLAQPARPSTNAWISDITGLNCELVRMSAHGSQALAEFPLHLVSLASMSDLNRRLPKAIEEVRFRPNIVVAGIEPFEEDRWTVLSAEQLNMDVLDLTDRCSVPNIDPESGMMSAEPLKTLTKFRRSGTRVDFGIYLRPRTTGHLRVGMNLSPYLSQDQILLARQC